MGLMGMTFNIKNSTGIEINIPINNKVTIITGDSATGKSKMLRDLDFMLQDTSLITSTTVNLNSIIICHNVRNALNLLSNNKSLNSKIIFIDDYDSIEPADETKLISIIRESKNLFVLMAHKDVPKCGYNHRSILGFEHDGKKYNAIQLFEVPSDYIMNQSVYI